MTRPDKPGELTALLQGTHPDVLTRLLDLLERIRWDESTGTLELRNGAAAIRLGADGTIRLSGERVIAVADRDVTLNGAWIDLN